MSWIAAVIRHTQQRTLNIVYVQADHAPALYKHCISVLLADYCIGTCCGSTEAQLLGAMLQSTYLYQTSAHVHTVSKLPKNLHNAADMYTLVQFHLLYCKICYLYMQDDVTCEPQCSVVLREMAKYATNMQAHVQ